jgi:hypothetical protein
MLNATVLGAFSGFAVFLSGVHGFRYMRARVLGDWNGIRTVRDLTGKYRVLVRAEGAPLWPLLVYRICIPLGIVVTFASIFLSRPGP